MERNPDETKNREIALFRYGVISDFVDGSKLNRHERRRLMKEKSGRKWEIPYSEKTRITPGTIRRWIREYNESGTDLESLCPKPRSDRGMSRTMDEDTASALKTLRAEMRAATVGQLISEMENRNLVTPGIKLNRSGVYRFLNQNGLMHPEDSAPADRRRFEAENVNDLWQSDVMHGPSVDCDGKKRKTYLIALIDDHSRLIPYARFYFSERLASYLDALYHALAKRGIPSKLYVDNGACFRSKKLQYVTASLNIGLIYATPYQPQGKGKIERWFKTVRSSFLPTFKGNTLDDLNAAFATWLDTVYHTRIHGSTGRTPFDRFTKNLHGIRPAPANLTDYFRTVARRRVGNDRTVIIQDRLFEAPVKLIGKRVEVYFHESDPDRVEVRYNGLSYGMLTKVNLHINSRVKRDKNNRPRIQSDDNGDYKSGGLFGNSKKEE